MLAIVMITKLWLIFAFLTRFYCIFTLDNEHAVIMYAHILKKTKFSLPIFFTRANMSTLSVRQAAEWREQKPGAPPPASCETSHGARPLSSKNGVVMTPFGKYGI